MPATIQIQDAGIQEIFSQRLFLFEKLIAAPASTPVFNQDIVIDREIFYVSSFLKWSTIKDGTASKVFGGIPFLVSVTDQDGLVYYGDTTLSASNTLNNLTDGKVYKIQRTRGSRIFVLKLRGGEKMLTSSGRIGFDFSFSSSSENWFPWSIAKQRRITQVLNDHRLSVSLITDSYGNTFSFSSVFSSLLQDFAPGQGYIVNATASFNITVEEEDDRTIDPNSFPFITPNFTISNQITDNKGIVKFVVSNKALKQAVEQIPTHSAITSLKASEVNRYKADDSTIPGAAEIKTFFGQRGLDITFDTLMKLSDDYAGTVGVYDRKDFQADYNRKVSAANLRDVKYTFKIKNNNAEIIAESTEFTAYNLEKLTDDLTLKVTNPITPTAPILGMNFIVLSDGVERKYQIHHYNRESYGEPIQESLSTANASNLIFPNRTRVFRLPWNEGKELFVHNLYLSNPT